MRLHATLAGVAMLAALAQPAFAQKVEVDHDRTVDFTYGWGTSGAAESREGDYAEGTLLVEMFDLREKRAIWRGTATDQLSADPERNRGKLEKACAKLFKKYPPGSKPKRDAK